MNTVYSEKLYVELLCLIEEQGYRFADFRQQPSSDERLVYLRHDIDYSPTWALAFARINARNGAAGTFFFRLRSPIYNLHAYSTLDVVHEISALGQSIGLHFDVEPGHESADDVLIARIKQDYEAAQALIPQLVPVFNWHNPSLVPKVLERGRDLQVPGLINTYSRTFTERVKYCSDSNLRYSADEIKDIVTGSDRRLQLLLHPFQWLAGGRDMQEVLANTWVQVIREREQEFLTNHVYRRLLPSGMPAEWLNELARRVAEHKQ